MQSLEPQLIQMSGVPGSGKSTIARALGERFDLVVLDHDVTKSAILNTGLADKAAGRASYEVIKALAEQWLNDGRTVLIDSPCIYPELLEFGERLSRRVGVAYRYIECQVQDLDLLHTRLAGRDAMPSQIRSLDGDVEISDGVWRPARDTFEQWRLNAARPSASLVLDTTRSAESCIEAACAYITRQVGSPAVLHPSASGARFSAIAAVSGSRGVGTQRRTVSSVSGADGARLTRLLAGLAPSMAEQLFVFCKPAPGVTNLPQALATFHEAEGQTLVLESGLARAGGLQFDGTFRCITLNVVSQLTDVGLTAVVAGALSDAGIAANVFAAMHHDHIFVPEVDAVRAIEILRTLAAEAQESLDGST